MAHEPSKVKLAEAVDTLKRALSESATADPNVRKLFNVNELSRAGSILRSEVA